MKRVVIIGGTGFIGEHLVKALIGKVQVTVLHHGGSFRPTKGVFYRAVGGHPLGEVLAEVLRDADAVAVLTPPIPGLLEEILRAVEISEVPCVLYASTFLLYRGGEWPQREDGVLEASTPYEKAKLREEDALRAWSQQHLNRGVTVARIANAYGDVKNRGIIGNLMRATVAEVPVELSNGGRGVRDFILVDDVAEALAELLMRETKTGLEVFNVSTGVGHAVRDVVAMVEKLTGKKLPVSPGPTMVESASVIGDPTKIGLVVGWRPKFDLAAGLQQTYQRFLAHPLS